MTTLPVGQGLARPQRWLRAHPLALDTALAGAVLAMVLVTLAVDHQPYRPPRFGTRVPDPLSVLVAVLAAAALVLRRRRPGRVLACTSVLSLLELVRGPGEEGAPVAMTAAVALYTVAHRTDRSTTWRVGALTIAVLTAAAMLFGPRPWYGQQNLGIAAWLGMAGAVGDAVRSRRAFVDAIRERAERAERTREEEARRRVAEERMRIARELHDVVAHHIALVNVQAGVAAHVMDARPDQAKEALAHVREASRSALSELRTTVGLLRQFGDPEAPTEPAPGLGVLDQLVDGFIRAGLPVEVEFSSTEPRGPWHSREPQRAADVIGELPAAVDLTAYRVVQEALTNAHKHAGDGASAMVRIARDRELLHITVVDDGTGDPGPAVPSAGPVPRYVAVRGGEREAARGGERVPAPAGPAAGVGADPRGPEAPAGPAAAGREAPGGGHGLIGMRERAAALGGLCEAGPRRPRGFRVRVRLPLTGTPIGRDRAGGRDGATTEPAAARSEEPRGEGAAARRRGRTREGTT